MPPRLILIVGAIILLPAQAAEGTKENRRYMAKPLMGDYYVYGGSSGDSTPPTSNDRKVSFMLTGPLAKELFDHIGRDSKVECKPSPDYRERRRSDLTCTWTKAYGHSCYFGMDGQTGKSLDDYDC
ncbi:hypothetical protein [Massilia sp. YIM B02443]|uniref:hypothetical protein n=1 Tax=Massilia sp. YIM B02443 TaxID=3050127 RepID=UPI0025B722AD|nr:hypothetical protein [Massilia sp. YIM B02443]MDN4035444.1 hypothetical protein [Massilia sp. YIM B02443]